MTANRTIESFYKWSGGGRIPIFCDTTSCTHTLLFETGGDILTPENREKYKQLKIMDITQWLKEVVLPRIKVIRPKNRILLHPTCSCQIMGLTPVLLDIARKCAREVILPDNWGCCGASGDRGFIFRSCLIRQPGMNGMKLAMNRSTVVILWHGPVRLRCRTISNNRMSRSFIWWMRQFRTRERRYEVLV